jgi:hypothetical protein
MIHIVEEIKLVLVPGNRLKHIIGNSEYKDSPGIWMIHIVEGIKLLLLYNLLYI